MDIAAALLVCVWMTLLAGALAYFAWRQVQIEKSAITDTIMAWVEKPSADQPSQLEIAAHAIAHIAADEIKTSISGAMMGHASAISKQLQAAEGDVALDGIQAQNPLIGLLLGMSPSLRKRVAKNPMAALALGQLTLGGHRPGNGAGARAPVAPGGFELGK